MKNLVLLGMKTGILTVWNSKIRADEIKNGRDRTLDVLPFVSAESKEENMAAAGICLAKDERS